MLEPFTLMPVHAVKPWGGRTLERLGKTLPPDVKVGETWEVADLPEEAVSAVSDPRSRVADGPLAGRTLRQVIELHGSDLLGSARPTPEGDFPLLVKLLDARQHLSVQVHPHREYVASHPTARLKTESWYVVDAEPGAVLFLGAAAGVTIEDFEKTAGRREVVDLLRRVPASPGDFHHLPAGMVHALGAGVVVAEVQTPSDTTFRLYDWTEEYGRSARDLHVAEALDSLLLRPPGAVSSRRAGSVRPLVRNDHFWMVEHLSSAPGTIRLDGVPELRLLMVLSGRVEIHGVAAGTGATVVIPAVAMASVRAESVEASIVLEIGLGSSR